MRGSILRCGVLVIAFLAVAIVAGEAGAQISISNPTQAENPNGFRRLAAGVEFTFPADINETEKTTRHDLIQIIDKSPKFGDRPWQEDLAKGYEIKTEVWALELTIKPMRVMWVDVPGENGKFDRKLIWYLWYHVKNTSDKPVTFDPIFVCHCEDVDKFYTDRLIPVAMGPIQKKEDPKRKVHDSVSISTVEIAPAGQSGDEVWGCALWEDIDPTTDKFSVYVRGLTNAYKMEAVDQEDGTRRWEYFYKTLQINFTRPGDEYDEHSREIKLGSKEGVEYRWIYN